MNVTGMKLFNLIRLIVPAILLQTLITPAFATPKENFLDIKLTPDRDLSSEAQGYLRADAREMEQLLGVSSIVEKIKNAKQGGQDTASLPKATQNARMLLLWRMLEASEEVRRVVNEIDFDLAETHIALDGLVAKKNMTSNMLNTANFFQGGICGVVKNSMALKKYNPVARQTIAISSFSTSLLLSTINLTVPYWYHKRPDRNGNMLAHIFDPAYKPRDAQNSYLWKFFNSPVPGAPQALTRREILVKHWQSFGGVRAGDDRTIKLVTDSPDNDINESIGLLNQRVSLLQDMKTHIEEFDACLFELHQSTTATTIASGSTGQNPPSIKWDSSSDQ